MKYTNDVGKIISILGAKEVHIKREKKVRNVLTETLHLRPDFKSHQGLVQHRHQERCKRVRKFCVA